jgi:hypothetical protein
MRSPGEVVRLGEVLADPRGDAVAHLDGLGGDQAGQAAQRQHDEQQQQHLGDDGGQGLPAAETAAQPLVHGIQQPGEDGGHEQGHGHAADHLVKQDRNEDHQSEQDDAADRFPCHASLPAGAKGGRAGAPRGGMGCMVAQRWVMG